MPVVMSMKSPTVIKNVNTKSTKLKSTPKKFSYFKNAERVNGRAAMLGFSSAVITEIVTHQTLPEQLMNNIPLAVIASGLVAIGTASNPNDEGVIWGNFRPEVEQLNGRAAMLGITSLFLNELATNNPLF